MELPRRNKDDILVRPGRMTELRQRLRSIVQAQDITTVLACAFDHRTRMLPFILADTKMLPTGPRNIAAALLDCGFQKTRLVLQQWNPRFAPSEARLDGRIPDILMISSMSLHTARCREMIRDIHRIPEDQRPWVIVGGSVCIYEPWTIYSNDPAHPYNPDISVTGETFVMLELLQRVLGQRGRDETPRAAFLRAKQEGLLNDIPGLIYPRLENGLTHTLVDTGIQRLVGCMDEDPWPDAGYTVLEPPNRRDRGLSAAPIEPGKVRNHVRIGGLVLTLGCKFRCPYCPIPAYNQGQYRSKSGDRIAEEIRRIAETYRIRHFFGADDNFFNDHQRTLEICETLASKTVNGKPMRRGAWIGTEATVHDTVALGDHMKLVRDAGFRAIWMGVEDMTGSLVNKGQSVDKTRQAFQLLRNEGILPMPMMMHHDTQPLLTHGDNYGLLNQVRLLAKAGACTLQVLMITPSAGSKLYRDTFESGMVYQSVAGKTVQPHMFDGNHVIASHDPRPWRKQFNLMAAYLYFYNPMRLVIAFYKRKFGNYRNTDVGMQIWGMYGLTQTIRRTAGWALRLLVGPVRRLRKPPASPIPMQDPDGNRAAHDISEA